MTEVSFRRYTNLAAALHLLRNRCLTLLDPETWDDRNDAFYMAEYKRITDSATILALCFAEKEETYHHWRIFSHGSDGVCVEFDKAAVMRAMDADPGIRHRRVSYKLLTHVSKITDVDVNELPFYKRWPYNNEAEYRLVFVDQVNKVSFHNVNIGLACIRRITLSPWLTPALVDAVKDTVRSINGCARLKIYQSTLINNKTWKKLARRATVLPRLS